MFRTDKLFTRIVFGNLYLQKRPAELPLHQQEQVVVYPSVRDFLNSVKRVGAGNSTRSTGGLPKARQLLSQMEAYYIEHFSTKDGIQVT